MYNSKMKVNLIHFNVIRYISIFEGNTFYFFAHESAHFYGSLQNDDTRCLGLIAKIGVAHVKLLKLSSTFFDFMY